jgi:hypothetical protein
LKLTTGFPCTLFYRVFANLARTVGITFTNFVLGLIGEELFVSISLPFNQAYPGLVFLCHSFNLANIYAVYANFIRKSIWARVMVLLLLRPHNIVENKKKLCYNKYRSKELSTKQRSTNL